jgi:hypothetical protein
MPGKRIAFEDADNDSTEIAEVLPNVAFFLCWPLARSASKVGTTKDENDLLGSYPIKGLSMTAKECGVSR